MPLSYISNDALGYDPSDLKKYFYRIGMQWTDGESNSYNIPDRSIIGFNIVCDYKNNIMPIYNITTVLNAHYYSVLQVNKSALDIKIKLSHFEVSPEIGHLGISEAFDEKAYNDTTDMFETMFQPYVDHLVPLTNQEMLTLTEEDVDPITDSQNIESIDCEFSLFNRESMNIVKSMSNIILQEVNVLDTLGVILTKSGVKKLIINNPDNGTIYDQVIIPPDNLVNTLDYIQKTYGIYNTGYRNFIDWNDIFYFLSNNNNDIPVKKNEYPVAEIYVMDTTDARGYFQGSLKDETAQMYRIMTGDKPTATESKSSANKEIIGNKLVFSNPKSKKYGTSYDDAGNFTFGSGVNVVAPALASDVEGDDKINYFYNDADNPYLEYEMQYRMEEKNQLLMFTFEDVDMSIFTMNRKFKITFEDPQYSDLDGYYKLEKAEFNFTRAKSEIYLKCTITAIFNLWPTFSIYNTRNDE